MVGAAGVGVGADGPAGGVGMVTGAGTGALGTVGEGVTGFWASSIVHSSIPSVEAGLGS